jgi:hypothetical protein
MRVKRCTPIFIGSSRAIRQFATTKSTERHTACGDARFPPGVNQLITFQGK